MRLGTAVLGGLLDQYRGTMPFAIAGYNAGPGAGGGLAGGERGAGGAGPRHGGLDRADPVQTRRATTSSAVIENLVIYRALQGSTLPHPLARWQG